MSSEDLFLSARNHIEKLENQLKVLEQENKQKDDVLRILRDDIPIISITGRGRSSLLNHLIESSAMDGIHPFFIDTKYYTANTFIVASENVVDELKDCHHARVLCFSDNFDQLQFEQVLDCEVEVKICICDESVTGDLCVRYGVEWVTWEDIGRVSEALSSTMWPNMVTKPRPQVTTTSQHVMAETSGPKEPKPEGKKRNKEVSEEEQLEVLERLMTRAREIRDNSGFLSDQERRQRAADAAEEMAILLGIDDDSDNDIIE
jgi:hypothetical protein